MGSYFNILIWEYSFYSPHWLWGLFLVPIVFFLLEWIQKNGLGQLKYSGESSEQKKLEVGKVRYFRLGIHFFYSLALGLLICTLAEPYNINIDPPHIDYKNGIDIVLSIDASGSMLAEDFEPNRLEAAKSVAQKFVKQRKGDRIGLVVYEGEAYTAVPATLDYKLLDEQIGLIEPGNLEPGTAVGNGLGLAVTRLRSDSLKSKVIILLTDGSNNAGTIEPIDAAKLAQAKNCTVYTIGVGSNGMASTPVPTPIGVVYQSMPVDLDETTLKEIARITGGQYFRATDNSALEDIYAEINKLEKRKMEDNHTNVDPPVLIFPFVFWSIVFILIALFVQRWKFKLDD
ncbi:MAG: vWA domain-containing protein [Fluviicola sp.]|jgi:Ca-activated chloride channel family protein